MQPSALMYDDLASHYTTAVDALQTIADAHYHVGKLVKAKDVLRTSLRLMEADEVKTSDHLKLLLLYGQVLITDHFLNATDPSPMFAVLPQARQITEAAHDQQGIADALSLLGQAHYFATLMARRMRGESTNSPQEKGEYIEALTYQQQALELREALHDTRGMSESHFYIGIVHERWQQEEQALAQYITALRIAEQYGHLAERSEPTRHLAGSALKKGDLDQALAYAQQALSLREAANFRPHQPFDHLLLSDIYLRRGDKGNARRHAEIASAMAAEMESTHVLAMANERLDQLNRQ